MSFARAVRAEFDRRKRRLGVLSYDDLLSQLADALADEAAPARDRMRQRWRVVLVDEFQDTDPVQWQVLDRAFTGHATMVLIGDPKQAIYAFRGGDVVTYLAAARTATRAPRWPRTTAATPPSSTGSPRCSRAPSSVTGDPRPAGHRGPAGLPPRRGRPSRTRSGCGSSTARRSAPPATKGSRSGGCVRSSPRTSPTTWPGSWPRA